MSFLRLFVPLKLLEELRNCCLRMHFILDPRLKLQQNAKQSDTGILVISLTSFAVILIFKKIRNKNKE